MLFRKSARLPGLRIQNVESILGTGPDQTRTVDENRIHMVIAHGVSVPLTVTEDLELRSLRVESHQSRSKTAQPQRPGRITGHGRIFCGCARRFDSKGPEVPGSGIKSVKAVRGSDPEYVITSAEQSGYRVVTQAGGIGVRMPACA